MNILFSVESESTVFFQGLDQTEKSNVYMTTIFCISTYLFTCLNTLKVLYDIYIESEIQFILSIRFYSLVKHQMLERECYDLFSIIARIVGYKT